MPLMYVYGYRYGFSAAVNSYQGIGYICNGDESSLRDCLATGSICAADSVEHAVAVSCDGNLQGRGRLKF